LFDVLGKKVNHFSGIKTSKYLIDRGDLKAGVYFVKITGNGQSVTKKIIFE
jgi:hypothetical protein